MKLKRTTVGPARWLLRTWKGRVLLTAALLVGSFGLVLAWIAGSVWIEDRYPADVPRRAILPAAQRVVSKPVVNALSRYVERQIRRRAERLFMATGLTLKETIGLFLDDSVPLSQRRIHAYRLAFVGSPECINALFEVFQTAPPEDLAFMAQLIGNTGASGASACLLPLLDHADPQVVKAALRGLGSVGDQQATARLASMLNDPAAPEMFRLEAASALGSIATATARGSLARALENNPSRTLATHILDTLGHSDFASVADAFRGVTEDHRAPSALRAAAVEALVHSSLDAVPFLIEIAGGDVDPEVRASAAWAIGAHGSAADVGPALMDLAEVEGAPDVRRRLYESMLPQAQLNADRLLQLARDEEDIAARVAAFNALGRSIALNGTAEHKSQFDLEIVPQLLRIATEPNSLNIQMRAVFALRRASTPATRAALSEIAARGAPQVATAARNGLHKPRS